MYMHASLFVVQPLTFHHLKLFTVSITLPTCTTQLPRLLWLLVSYQQWHLAFSNSVQKALALLVARQQNIWIFEVNLSDLWPTKLNILQTMFGTRSIVLWVIVIFLVSVIKSSGLLECSAYEPSYTFSHNVNLRVISNCISGSHLLLSWKKFYKFLEFYSFIGRMSSCPLTLCYLWIPVLLVVS